MLGIKLLQQKIDEYLLTIDNDYVANEESWSTPRELTSFELAGFMDWLININCNS